MINNMVDNLFHDQADILTDEIMNTDWHPLNDSFLDLILGMCDRPADGAPFSI
jgi:hypothetical protein